jgi:CRP-like cAMP-binding protein
MVHADLKPENIMLSTENASDAVVKLVDFGCAVTSPIQTTSHTPAYSPPETFQKNTAVLPPRDMWALGVILYMMLTGAHPFDLNGTATDQEIEQLVTDHRKRIPIRRHAFTDHVSSSAKNLLEQLLNRNANERMTAFEMLEHPWVRGETATSETIAGSDERLGKLKLYKTKLQQNFFADVIKWSDEDAGDNDTTKHRGGLMERSFRSIDLNQKGVLTTVDLGQKLGESSNPSEASDDAGPALTMSDFHTLLSETMKSRYFPKGAIIYKQGDIGNHMYVLNSGSVLVTTHDGSQAVRDMGDFFGEGALLNNRKIRSATIECRTPVHAYEISREYFEKYLKSKDLLLTLREKDKIRKRNRAKTILRLQTKDLHECDFQAGDKLFTEGDQGDSIYNVEHGNIDITIRDRLVFTATPGNLCGEHSLITGRPRNVTATCASKDGCKCSKMMGADFHKLLESSPGMHESLRDLCLRRDFKKAVVHRLQKEFPYDNPREAFDAVIGQRGRKKGSVGVHPAAESDGKEEECIGIQLLTELMREFNPTYSKEGTYIFCEVSCAMLLSTYALLFSSTNVILLPLLLTEPIQK